MPHEVKLEVFEGPIDLLLNLIGRRRVDIYDVPLAAITDEYMGVLARMGTTDLETSTGFLVVAATLLELKSSRLLPARETDEVDTTLLEGRDLLLARLLECATYRASGAWIAAGLEIGAAWHGRTAGLEPQLVDLAPDPLANLGGDDLARAAALALAPTPAELDTSFEPPATVSVREAILAVAAELERSGRATLEELCGIRPAPIDVVARFLALLELFKTGAVDLDQKERFGAIEAVWTGEADVTAAVDAAEEYSVGREGP
ncbi:MAG: segregation/condensation protein A [Actinomycetota bacterium]|nr:segregation/condensation protein A [Actinomycetota bacterium]